MKALEKPVGFSRRAAAIAGATALAMSLGACSSTRSAPAPREFSSVVGLGGSFEAGFAAGPHASGMPKRCLQTTAASPRQVAHELDIPVHDYACSGATTADVLGESGSRRQPAQLRLAKPAMRGALVIVLVGGNDVGWMQYQAGCVRQSCAPIPEGAEASNRYNQLEQNIETIVDTANRDGASKVLVDGYENPGKLGCLRALGLTHHRMTRRDYRRMDLELGLLNGALETGADNAGARYVPLEREFDSHGVCPPRVASGADPEPWIGGPHGLNHGGESHPNAEGQSAIARLNLQALAT